MGKRSFWVIASRTAFSNAAFKPALIDKKDTYSETVNPWNKKIARIKRVLIVSFVCTLWWITGCVSPYYGTARIEPGWHWGYGMGVHSFMTPVLDADPYSIGIRNDLSVSCGFNRNLGANFQLGLGYSLYGTGDGFFDALLGLQAALPLGPVTPALRTDIAFYSLLPTFSPCLILGVGEREFLTLSARTNIVPGFIMDGAQDSYPITLGLAIHPSPSWSLFMGTDITTLEADPSGNIRPLATAGLGYNFGRKDTSETVGFSFSLVPDFCLVWRLEPFHHYRAGINQGWKFGTCIEPVCYYDGPDIGALADVDVSFGVNRYIGLFSHAHTGVERIVNYSEFVAKLASGIQLSLPLKGITPALRCEAIFSESFEGISPCLLVGVGKDERVTFATRLGWSFYAAMDPYRESNFLDVTVNVNLAPEWSIFAGADVIGLIFPSVWGPYWTAELGAKYTFVNIALNGKKNDKDVESH